MKNKRIIIVLGVVLVVIIGSTILLFFSMEFKQKTTIDFQQINQTNILYADTHVERIDGIHYSTINQTEIIDKNTIKIKFEDNDGYVGGNGNIIYRIPQFEFTTKVDVGDKFISRCVERDDYDVNSLSILHLRDIDNSLLFFDHYSVLVPQTIECKYPDIIKHSFDHDWTFTEVTESEIREVPMY